MFACGCRHLLAAFSPGQQLAPLARPQRERGFSLPIQSLWGCPRNEAKGPLTMSHLTLAESAQEPNRDREQCRARPQSGRDGA